MFSLLYSHCLEIIIMSDYYLVFVGVDKMLNLTWAFMCMLTEHVKKNNIVKSFYFKYASPYVFLALSFEVNFHKEKELLEWRDTQTFAREIWNNSLNQFPIIFFKTVDIMEMYIDLSTHFGAHQSWSYWSHW